MRQFAIIVKPNQENGGFIATVPGHPGVVGQGETEEAALKSARTALESTSGAGNGESMSYSFNARPDLQTLADEQGVKVADDFDTLLGDFWPEEESADEFVAALREWRREGLDA